MIEKCFSESNEHLLPEDIMIDLELAYSNPERSMIGLDIDDLCRFLEQDAVIQIARSLSEVKSCSCTHAVLFRTADDHFSFDEYREWFRNCANKLSVTESTVVIPIVLLESSSSSREWLLYRN